MRCGGDLLRTTGACKPQTCCSDTLSMFRVCTRALRDHLLLLQALMTGVRKRGSGTNEPANNERAKLHRAAVAISEILPYLNQVAPCFECCTKTLRR